jgi:hypothetical protein
MHIQIANATAHQTSWLCLQRFYEKILQKTHSDEIFLDSVCFSDEATLILNGIVNITAEFGVVSDLKDLSNINGICQRLNCEVA